MPLHVTNQNLRKVSTVMGLYLAHFLSEQAVVSWADEQILKEGDPFELIISLSLKGPRHCYVYEHGFPSPRSFTFIEEFSLRTRNLDMKDIEQAKSFMQWIACYVMGEDLKQPEIQLGYEIDHHLFDCDDFDGAYQILERELAIYVPKHKTLAEEIWKSIE